jgi:hypothetical protein
METQEDTDTLLALLSSLLPTSSIPYDQALLLDALVETKGDVQDAARFLKSKQEKKRGEKRKRSSGLDDWLKSPVTKSATGRGEKSSKDIITDNLDRASSPGPRFSSKSPTKPAVDLMSVLRQPPSMPQTLPRTPPLTLSNPSLVARHTPCTLHLSVLPPELACRLFYTMIDASRGWQRNKWWLFDRLVESPHRTSFYTRKNDGINSKDSWQEAAQYW